MSRYRGGLGSEQGSILVLSLLVTLIVLGVGLTVMWAASSGLRVAGNVTRRQEAMYAAEAGMEMAKAVLATTSSWSSLLAAPTGCTPLSDDLKGIVLCAGTEPLQNKEVAPAAAATTHALPGGSSMKYTVWIRNDWGTECDSTETNKNNVDCDGNPGADPTLRDTDGNNRVIVRSEGLARDGVSFVALEAVIARGGAGPAAEAAYSQGGLNAQGSSSAKVSISP
jgi:Tfp pilus assembly protein PilX